jgi:uncharacterized protein YecE (DUF72 family)
MRWDEALAAYVRAFDSVEVNNSFYRLPDEEVFRAWREQTPPGFCFAVNRYSRKWSVRGQPLSPRNAPGG